MHPHPAIEVCTPSGPGLLTIHIPPATKSSDIRRRRSSFRSEVVADTSTTSVWHSWKYNVRGHLQVLEEEAEKALARYGTVVRNVLVPAVFVVLLLSVVALPLALVLAGKLWG
jgi:hypothetical protein